MNSENNSVCFKCGCTEKTINELIKHFKTYHFLSSTEIVECRQQKCKQVFSNFNSFRVHLKYIHKINSAERIEPLNTSIINNNISVTNNNLYEAQSSSANYIESISTTENTNANENLFTTLKDEVIKFSLQLYAKSFMPRKEVINIQNSISKIFFSILIILQQIKNSLVENQHIMSNLNLLIQFCKDPFSEIKSEYLFFKILKEKNLLEFPKMYNINCTIGERVDGGIPNFGLNFTNTYLLPLRFQIKKFFELPGMYKMIRSNTDKLIDSGELSNFVCGEVYKKKLETLNKPNVLPFFLYLDDIQINDPLGSHKSSMCACYYIFPTMPQYLLSKLKYIFKVAYIDSKDMKTVENEHMLHQLIEELTYLEEEGITIETSEGSFTIHFVLGLILGDNLGLNTILGYNRSFNAKQFCRACKMGKLETQICAEEIFELLRNEENFENDWNTMDPTMTGIRENCVFNSLKSFHVTDNFCFDIMHDLFEGMCEYDVCQILKALISDPEVNLSLEDLNNRKRLFSYGELEINNSSRDLSYKRLESNNLDMTASEIWSFVHFLPLMIGDLIDYSNKHWALLCLLINVLDGCLLSKYSPVQLLKLENDIKDHHNLYVELFGNTLKPKHHFVLHYPTSIKKCGPLKFLWCMRLEAEHKNIKNYCKNITSRMNLALSCCKKACLQFSHFLINYECETDFDISEFEFINFAETQLYSKIHNPQNFNLEHIQFSKCANYRNNLYKTNYYLSIKKDDNINSISVYKIIGVLLVNNKMFVMVNEITVLNYNPHLISYEIGCLNSFIDIKFIAEFTSPPLHRYIMNDGKTYIRNKII